MCQIYVMIGRHGTPVHTPKPAWVGRVERPPGFNLPKLRVSFERKNLRILKNARLCPPCLLFYKYNRESPQFEAPGILPYNTPESHPCKSVQSYSGRLLDVPWCYSWFQRDATASPFDVFFFLLLFLLPPSLALNPQGIK
jgi:hypothetical protein